VTAVLFPVSVSPRPYRERETGPGWVPAADLITQPSAMSVVRA
jgi:hypothetical protein